MTNKIDKSPDFGIEISFENNQNPSRIFKALSELIESFQSFDDDLVKSISSDIKPVILLEDLQKGSVKAWFKNAIEGIPDEGIKDLEWKKIVGGYLVRGKYALIKFLDGKTEITNKQDIKSLEEDLFKLAKETKVNKLAVYTPIPTSQLIGNIQKITTATQGLNKSGDKLIYSASKEEKTEFNLQFNFSPESIIDLMTKESLSSDQIMILKVKKPDYLGESKWELKYERSLIDAKITDQDWLFKFQNRQVNVRPGDSIKANTRVTVKYDFNNEVIATLYDIYKVIEIIAAETSNQIDLFE